MKRFSHPVAATLIAFGALVGALVAPALACGIGQACAMHVAASPCALPGAADDWGGTTLTEAPPACCAGQANAPVAALRDAPAPRTEWTIDSIAVVIPHRSFRPATAVVLRADPATPSVPQRNPLSLSDTLLL